MATIKGENLRILIGEDAAHLKCVAASTSCVIHVSAIVEEDTTKDVVDEWINNEVTALAWDAQVDALIINDDEETGAILADALQPGMEYTLRFTQTAETSGTQNREAIANSMQYTGKAILSDLNYAATNQDISTASAKFTGSADLVRYTPPQSN